MRSLPHQLALRNPQSLCDDVEADNLCLAEHGQTLGAVAVGPLHEVRLLAGRFYQIPQERLLIVG